MPNEDLNVIMNDFYPTGNPAEHLSVTDAHRLAVLFMIFQLGTIMDLEKDSVTAASDSELFHLLARAALVADPLTEHTTVSGIQAFVRMWSRILRP